MPEINPLEIPKIKQAIEHIPPELQDEAKAEVLRLWNIGMVQLDTLISAILQVYGVPPAETRTFEESSEHLGNLNAEADLYHAQMVQRTELVKDALINIIIGALIAKYGV